VNSGTQNAKILAKKQGRKSMLPHSSNKNSQFDILVLFGAETEQKILHLQDFRSLGIKGGIAAEDRSPSYTMIY